MGQNCCSDAHRAPLQHLGNVPTEEQKLFENFQTIDQQKHTENDLMQGNAILEEENSEQLKQQEEQLQQQQQQQHPQHEEQKIDDQEISKENELQQDINEIYVEIDDYKEKSEKANQEPNFQTQQEPHTNIHKPLLSFATLIQDLPEEYQEIRDNIDEKYGLYEYKNPEYSDPEAIDLPGYYQLQGNQIYKGQ